MALVASSLVMAHSEATLMERPRYHRPPLPSDTEPRLTPSIPHSDSNAETLRVQEGSRSRTHAARSNRKKIFSFATTADMETYNGHVRTPADAIVLFEACRLGLLPRVQRRLSEKERQSISSGSVFVWDEREAGMRRWTDGKSWSASRVSGSFLTYREMEGKRGGGGAGFPPVATMSRGGRTPEQHNPHGAESDVENGGDEGPDGYRYKPDGLMKQSFSITTSSGNHLHLISYYSRSHPASSRLNNPTNDPALRHIRPAKGMYPESTVHEHQNIPAVTRSPMASAPFSTVPQMAGYARQQGPSQWPAPQHNGYPWGQQVSAHHQPPPQYPYGYQYNNNPSPYSPAPPPSNGQAPFQYSQQQAHTPTPQRRDDRNPAYDTIRDPAASQPTDPGTSGFDSRRQPPAQSENRAPPPVHHPHESSYTNGYQPRQEYNAAQWDPPRYPPRPLAPLDNRGTPAQYSSLQSIPSGGPPHQQSQYRSPHVATAPQSASQPQSQSANPISAPSVSHIDPRLMAPAPPPPHQPSVSNEQSRSSPPAAPHAPPQTSIPSQANSTSQASTRPSIGALMNGSSARNYSNGHLNSHGTAHPLPINTHGNERPGARSPIGSQKKDGPKDIPSGNLGFSEDMRALKVLDKGSFKT